MNANRIMQDRNVTRQTMYVLYLRNQALLYRDEVGVRNYDQMLQMQIYRMFHIRYYLHDVIVRQVRPQLNIINACEVFDAKIFSDSIMHINCFG